MMLSRIISMISLLVIPSALAGYRCPFGIVATRINLPSAPSGKYFNFWERTTNAILGRPSAPSSEVRNVYNYRTRSEHRVRMWSNDNPDCANAADACGREEPLSNAQAHDWQPGDVLAFPGTQLKCPTGSRIISEPFAVIDNSHNWFSSVWRGVYFRFLRSTVDNILGHTGWHGKRFRIRNLRTGGIRTVMLWRDNTGGPNIRNTYGHSLTLGHGRDDPRSSGNSGYWQVGDVLEFVDKRVLGDSQPFDFINEYNRNYFIYGSIIAILLFVNILCMSYWFCKRHCKSMSNPKYKLVKVVDSESEAEKIAINNED